MSSFQLRHKEWGIYQGSCLGFGFWHPLSEMPEQGFAEFETKEGIQDYIDFLCSAKCAYPVNRDDLSIEPFDKAESDRLIKESTMSGSNQFSNDLYNKLKDNDEDLFFSGYSISTALGMTAVGARNDTEKALCHLLHVPLNREERNDEYAKLVSEVNGTETRPYELTTANALWGEQGFEFNQEFLATVAAKYQGGFEVVDYSKPEEAVARINSWTGEKTKDKIKEIVTKDNISRDTRLILTNAIYFKGKWTKQFDKKRTQEGYWKGFARVTTASLMNQTGSFNYFEDDNLQALDLPYQGDDLSLLVVLPKGADRQSFTDVENSLNYTRVVSSLYLEKEVVVTLPKFKLEAKFKLKGILTEMGAGIAFSNQADFSGITAAERLKISEVLHKAFVEVGEEGTEAAAVTAVVAVSFSAAISPRTPPKVFNADHPFLFFIRNKKSGEILFQGRKLG